MTKPSVASFRCHCPKPLQLRPDGDGVHVWWREPHWTVLQACVPLGLGPRLAVSKITSVVMPRSPAQRQPGRKRDSRKLPSFSGPRTSWAFLCPFLCGGKPFARAAGKHRLQTHREALSLSDGGFLLGTRLSPRNGHALEVPFPGGKRLSARGEAPRQAGPSRRRGRTARARTPAVPFPRCIGRAANHPVAVLSHGCAGTDPGSN